MVAKSYQNLKQVCEPYLKSGRMYVKVQQGNNQREVRWYTEEEYAKMYGIKVEKAVTPQKKILGFENGYITLFKGDTYANLEWFQRSIARYHRVWGWYIVSTDTIPFDLPEGLTPVELRWEQVGDENGILYDDNTVRKVVDDLLYEKSNSKFQGSVNERLDLVVTVTKAIYGENYFGNYTLYEMVDNDGNVYVWKTSSKDWEVGTVKHIKGTIKEHKTYKNTDKTILTRCQEVK